MRLVRLVRLDAYSAIKVRIIVKDRIRDIWLRSRSASGLKFELVSYVILRKNNRRTGATSVTFRTGIVRF